MEINDEENPINYDLYEVCQNEKGVPKNNILRYWDELKLYFQMTKEYNGSEGKCKARMNADKVNNNEIILYYLFLHSIVV